MKKTIFFCVIFIVVYASLFTVVVVNEDWNVSTTPSGWYIEGYEGSSHTSIGTPKNNADLFVNDGSSPNYLRLTKNAGYNRAWAYYTEKQIKVLGEWSIELDIRIGQSHDGSEIINGADGLAIVFLDKSYVEDNGSIVPGRFEGGYGEWEGAPRGSYPNTPASGAKGYHSEEDFQGYSFEWDHYRNTNEFQEYNHWVELEDWIHSGFGKNMGTPENGYYYNDGWRHCKLSSNGSGTFTFQYSNDTDNDFEGSFTFSPGGSGSTGYTPLTTDYWAYIGFTASTGGQTAFHEIKNLVISAEEDDVLPVTLSTFNCAYTSNGAQLNWITQSETNNLGWNIYRSIDNDNSEGLQINPYLIEGAGSTTEPTSYSFLDASLIELIESEQLPSGTPVYYWLESYSNSGNTEMFGPVVLTLEGDPEMPEPPQIAKLVGNFPNPFNPSTRIMFEIPAAESGVLSIFNIQGDLLLEENFSAGYHDYRWNAEGMSSGIYFYKLSTEDQDITRKMLLIK